MERNFLLNKSGKLNSRAANPKWWHDKPFSYQQFLLETSFLSENTPFYERGYCFLHHITQYPKCVVCGENCMFLRTKQKYSDVCSVKCSSLNPLRKEKMFQTKLKKYNDVNYVNTEKARQTRLRKYGKWDSECAFLNKKKKSYPHLYDRELIYELHHHEHLTAVEIAKKLNVSTSFIDKLLDQLSIPKKRFKHSAKERELLNYIRSIYSGEIESNKQIDTFEIDIYLPEKQIGFEFNGNYWHSLYTENKHLKKTNYFEAKNIRLIHIFEHLWFHERTKIEIFLKSILCQPIEKLYARCCDIQYVDKQIAHEFFRKYHLQNSAPAKWFLGLFYKNNLVACCSFGKHRFTKTQDLELIRFASSCKVLGGLSKICKHFLSDKKNVNLITYADRTYFDGHSYLKSGFEYVGNTTPSYVWLHPNDALTVFSRYQTQKHKLPKLLKEQFQSNKTEEQNMYGAGYQKLWLLGHKKFIMKSSNR